MALVSVLIIGTDKEGTKPGKGKSCRRKCGMTAVCSKKQKRVISRKLQKKKKAHGVSWTKKQRGIYNRVIWAVDLVENKPKLRGFKKS